MMIKIKDAQICLKIKDFKFLNIEELARLKICMQVCRFNPYY